MLLIVGQIKIINVEKREKDFIKIIMRLSDILKRKEDIKEQQTLPKEPNKELPEKIELAKIEQKESQLISVEKVYAESINFIKKLFIDLSKNKKNIDISDIQKVIHDIITLMKQRNDEILIYATYSTVDSYIYAHSVNVSIYSLVIGEQKNFSDEEMYILGLASIFHDIGMIRLLSTVEKEEKLTEPEFEEIKKHSEYIVEELSKINIDKKLKLELIEIIKQVHERIDGSGYLSGLKNEEINIYAKIISIADVYEAMTHPRPYRDRILPHHAITELIQHSKGKFEEELLKLFVNRISLFPVGSYVKLSSGDIARVISANISLPIRPKVKIILTSENVAPKQEQIIDLLKETKIFITEPVDETKLDIKDKKLLLQLKSQRWWVKSML